MLLLSTFVFQILDLMRVAVVGATGMVGQVMLNVLAERNFPISELIPVASERSVGKEIQYKNKNYKFLEIGARQGGLSLWLALNGNQVVCSDIGYEKKPKELEKCFPSRCC